MVARQLPGWSPSDGRARPAKRGVSERSPRSSTFASTPRRSASASRSATSRKLVGLHGRAVDPDQEPRYRMYLQGGRTIRSSGSARHGSILNKPIVVVEGPFDLTTVRGSTPTSSRRFSQRRASRRSGAWPTPSNGSPSLIVELAATRGASRSTKVLDQTIDASSEAAEGFQGPGRDAAERINHDPVSDPRNG